MNFLKCMICVFYSVMQLFVNVTNLRKQFTFNVLKGEFRFFSIKWKEFHFRTFLLKIFVCIHIFELNITLSKPVYTEIYKRIWVLIWLLAVIDKISFLNVLHVFQSIHNLCLRHEFPFLFFFNLMTMKFRSKLIRTIKY